jgi:hypothetical protein
MDKVGPTLVIPSVPGFPASRPSPTPTCAAFSKESRMKFANATNLNRKSGAAEGSAVSLFSSHADTEARIAS